MKKVLIGMVIVCFIIVIAVFVCDFKKEKEFPKEILGTWEGSWENNGNYISEVISIYDDGYYEMLDYSNGDIKRQRYGIWEILGYNEVRFYYRGKDGPYNVYQFTNGSLATWDEDGEKENIIFVKKY